MSKNLPYIEGRFGRLLQPFRNGRVLELGCGQGHLLSYLEMKGFSDFVGVDISKEQIEIAQQQGLPAKIGDVIAYLEDLNSEIDVIVAIDFIEHFSRDELILLFQGIQRALKPSGLLILQTPNGAGWLPGRTVWGDLTHMTVFTPNSLRQLLSLFGFQNIHFAETGPVPHGILSSLRFIGWQLVRVILSLIKAIETGSGQQVWSQSMVCWACRE